MRNLVIPILACLITACTPVGQGEVPTLSNTTKEVTMTLSLSSTAFATGQPIPSVYSCKGRSVSPPLSWSKVPDGVKSFALIMDDPDATIGTFAHWVIYNIPPTNTSLPEAIPTKAQLPDGTVQGNNGAGRPGYMGPCPPSGTHRYFFKLYALDAIINLASGASKDQLVKVMEGHILAQGELMGTFSN